jgi:chromosome segregation ATPase
MPHDDLDHIPSIVPTRDGMPQRSSTNRARAGSNEQGRGAGAHSVPASGGGTGMLVRLLLAVSLLAAAAACVWAWQLQAQVRHANDQIASYATRIGDLEARLSDTDEGMNQNAETQAEKLAKLDTEVRKLWDNVWKETRDRLTKLEAATASQGKSTKGLEGSLAGVQPQLKELAADIAKLKSVSGDLARLMESAKANQAEVERVADSLNRMNLTLAKLEKRVVGNEEWVGSVNAFRKQVNTSISELQAQVRALQSPQ